MIYEEMGDEVRAEQAYIRGTVANPKLPRPYLMLGRLYARKGKYELAARKYEETLRLDPRNPHLYTLIGNLHEQQGNVDLAQSYYERALRVDPNYALAANNLAYALADRGVNLDRALELAKMARERMPRDPNVADTLGWVHYKRGEYREALPFLQEAASQDPKNPVIRYHLGMTYYRLGDRASARRELAAALGLRQDFREAGEARRVVEELR
jgi:Flp pilus assembly protein TadD